MPTGTTSDDDGKCKAYEFEIKPVNTATGDADSNSSTKIKIGVKGKKPRLTTKTITLERGNESYDVEDCSFQPTSQTTTAHLSHGHGTPTLTTRHWDLAMK